MRLARSVASAAALLITLGCPASDEPGGADGTGSTGVGSTSNASDPGATSQVSGADTATGAGTTMTDPDSSDGGMDTAGFITAGSSDDGPTGDLPNGEFCMSGADCMSGFCFAPIPGVEGVCSDCESDADCELGVCSPDFGAGFAMCTDGSLGTDCEDDGDCVDDLVCASIFDGGGFAPSACSECREDTPCPAGQSCTIITDMGLQSAYFGCVDDGTVPLGEICPVVDGVGNGAICMSGECAVISVFMDTIEIGICSECDEDLDCPMGMTCAPPDFGMGGAVPGTCV